MTGTVAHDYLETLNPEQRAAATWGESSGDGGVRSGPLLIIAGAGTGKTMTLAHRVAHLLVEGVHPTRILLLTFSRRAAREMTDRARRIAARALADAGGGSLRLPWAGTFHSMANRLLREYAPNVGLDTSFTVLDRGDSADLMDVARQEIDLSASARRFPRKDTCLAIYSRCVNARADLGDVLQENWPWCVEWEAELKQLFRRYVELKQASTALDYDDLLLYWRHLVDDPELAASVSDRFDHILVDEYQDTNVLQAEIIQAIRPDGRCVTAVGDDAQSIYSFRAATVENILSFPEVFSQPARVVTLEQNYRSVVPVLETSNALMDEAQRRYQKKLWSKRASEQRPRFVTVEDDAAQADYVVRQVLAAREAGIKLMDQAVLFRNTHHSDALELELTRRKIPYVKYGGLKFLEAAHVKDFLGILRWAENPKDRIAVFRSAQLLSGLGPAAASRCFEHLQANDFQLGSLQGFRPPPAAGPEWHALTETLESLGDGLGDWQWQLTKVRQWYQPVLERLYDTWAVREGDLEALEQIAARYPTRERFLTELTLDPPSSTGDLAGPPHIDEDYLVLSTVHSAKGQEWNDVYILNVADGNFPSEFATGREHLVEEERRLLYVAMTRAKDNLHLLAPLKYWVKWQRKHGDRHVYGARSRFISDRLMDTLEPCFHGVPNKPGVADPRPDRVVDVGARLRDMW